jgi:hypothetical protein
MDMIGMGKEAKGAAEDTVERASKKQKKGTAEDTDKRASKKQKRGTAEGTAGGDKPQKKRATKKREKRDKNAAQDTGNRSKPVAERKMSPTEVAIPQSPEHRREAPIGRVPVPATLQHQRPPDGRPVQRQAHIPDGGMHAYDTLINSDEAEPSNEEMMEFLIMMLLLQGHAPTLALLNMPY